jgi:hypothetical protein
MIGSISGISGASNEICTSPRYAMDSMFRAEQLNVLNLVSIVSHFIFDFSSCFAHNWVFASPYGFVDCQNLLEICFIYFITSFTLQFFSLVEEVLDPTCNMSKMVYNK